MLWLSHAADVAGYDWGITPRDGLGAVSIPSRRGIGVGILVLVRPDLRQISARLQRPILEPSAPQEPRRRTF